MSAAGLFAQLVSSAPSDWYNTDIVAGSVSGAIIENDDKPETQERGLNRT
ncbi:hypothetical protein B8V81_3798 [Paenibacillus pasadenensis]|uniref:Uncharacterized protein n=1 Tax=Paenibacillus pasadenensis TaxID=217090 RepID=A0A2N5N4U7_9BACL|nr:hypothetical protein B8V81_3798 [Paenibacillus pasadenensis]